MPLLNDADYPAVRATLLLGITSEMLPNDVIALPIFQQAAEAEVLRCDPTAASRTGAEAEAIGRATIYLTAALIAPSVPNLIEHEEDRVRVKMEAVDWQVKARELKDMATAELNNLLNPSNLTAQMPVMFTLAEGKRLC